VNSVRATTRLEGIHSESDCVPIVFRFPNNDSELYTFLTKVASNGRRCPHGKGKRCPSPASNDDDARARTILFGGATFFVRGQEQKRGAGLAIACSGFSTSFNMEIIIISLGLVPVESLSLHSNRLCETLQPT
jgi:hypothetical protein